ncbi:hypothetical protein SprV_0401528000 [Sparganum proliferum]
MDRVHVAGVVGGGLTFVGVPGLYAVMVVSGAAVADFGTMEEEEEEEEEGKMEEDDSQASGVWPVLAFGMEDEAEFDTETAAGVIRVLKLIRRCHTRPIGAPNVRWQRG